ncbi:hypothetical protein C8T65DRAFT_750039 [Cerioporus squamosus]|nr:hypothetical protein C8T65DRAFT_750039 [Cerioporus squamosus]
MPASASAVPSPTLTSSTHRRVQEVLRDLVREHQAAIQYSTLLARVRPVTLRSTSSIHSAFRKDVRKSVMHLLQAKHIALNVSVDPPVVVLTPSGKQFYKAYSPPPSRAERTPKVPRPSRKAQAIAEYQRWATPLITIQNIIAERALNPDEKCPVKQISAIVHSDLESADELRGENSDLSHRINDLSWEVDQFMTETEARDDTN